MSLQGDVSGVGLSEVFQMISMSQREGTLIVHDSVSRKSFHFGRQGVHVLSVGERKGLRLGDILVRTELITQNQLAEALEIAASEKKMLGEALVENGYVTEEDVQDAVRGQIEEEIYDLFLWQKAKFEFIEGPSAESPADAPAKRVSFDVNGLLLEAMRRAETWEQIHRKIPSLDGIFVFVSEAARAEEDRTATDSLRRVYRLLDGQRSVAELVEDTVVPKFEACKCLVELIDRRRVRSLTVGELLARAAKLLAGGERNRALRLYGAAEAQAAGDPIALEGIARALEAMGLAPEAAACLVRLGRGFLERKDLVHALEHMRRACAIWPESLPGRVGTLDILVAGGEVAKAKELARDFVSRALRSSDPLGARALCDVVLAADPADLEFRVFRAKALHHANLPRELYDELKFIHRNLPSDPEVAEKILRELPESRYGTRPPTSVLLTAPPRRRGRKLAWGVLALFLILAGAAATYEMGARAELDRTIAAARKRVDEGAWREARTRVDGFLRGGYRHAVTPRARTAAFLAEIDARERAAVADQTSREEGRRLAEERRTKEFTDEEAGIRAEWPPRPVRALERARALVDLARSKGSAEDVRRAVDLAEELDQFLSGARRLKERVGLLIEERKFAEATEAVDQLIADFPNTDEARDAVYPLAISSKPRGVKVIQVRTGAEVGVTSGAPLLLFLKPSETARLAFEKQGYVSPPSREVSRKTGGTLVVELTEKTAEWTWTAGHPLTGDPAVLGDRVFVAGADVLYALKAGPARELVWSEKLDGIVEGSPRVSNGRVVVATTGPWLYAIDPGKPEAQRAAGRYALGDRPSGPPGVSPDGSVIYIGTGDRLLHAVNARTMEGIWKQPMSGEVRVEPMAEGDLVFAASDNGALSAFEASTGREVWKARGQLPFGPLCLSDGTLYVASAEPFLYGVDAAKGRNVWARRALPARVMGRPHRAGPLILTGALDGNMHLTDAVSGAPAGSIPGGAAIRGGAASSGYVVLFGNDEGTLQAVDAAIREPLWKLRCKGPIRGTPVVAAGRIFLTCGDTLYVVGLD